MSELVSGPVNDRHAVITGGTGALGSAVVARLLADGVRCHVSYVDEHELNGYAHTGAVELQRVDVGDEAAVQAFYAALPQLDASIHLVGGYMAKPLAETALADFERMFRLNAATAFLCCRAAIARMRASQSARGGRIVNVAARPALVPTAGMIAYATAKTAVAALTTALSAEVAAEGIFVNAVVPSLMDTAANRRAMPKADFAAWPKVEEVAETIAFLAGPSNMLTSGALVPVYGRS